MNERLEFAAARGATLRRTDDELRPIVLQALEEYIDGHHDWFDHIVDGAGTLWWETFETEQGRAPTSLEVAGFQSEMAAALERTTMPDDPPDDVQVDTVTRWSSTYAVNAATAAGDGRVEWVTREDADVRDQHRPLDGRLRGEDGTWTVGGYQLRFPGEPVGPPVLWINCRCLARRIGEGHMADITAAAVDEDQDTTDEAPPEWSDDMDTAVPWHGVLAPIGTMSGDRRRFAQMLRTRDLPQPLRWQKADAEGHDGSVVVGNIESIVADGDLIKASGRFHVSSEADEAIALIANRMIGGVSVDLDDATVELQNEDGSAFDLENFAPGDPAPVQTIVDGRISSAALVAIPAFAEAYVALGPWEDEEDLTASCAPCDAMDEAQAWVDEFASISHMPWDGSSSRFTDEEWQRSCVLDRGSSYSTIKQRWALPIREPSGAINRAGVHAAAARISQVNASDMAKAAARRRLLAAYHTLGDEPPESVTSSAFVDLGIESDEQLRDAVGVPSPSQVVLALAGREYQFAPGTHDGPGWTTHPRDSQRLRDYWTRGAGAAKIRWGVPGDFDRCRQHLAKYVPNPAWLAGTCANLHKEAIKIWPGQEDGGRGHHHQVDATLTAAAFTLVAGGYPTPPAVWFTNPDLPGPTPLTVSDTGRVFGHLAVWQTCHVGLGLSVGRGEACVTAPHSASGYAFFNTGGVLCDDGTVAAVGHITLGTGHAAGRLAAGPAAAHYDNTGTVVADVTAGEDEHGIWVAGWVRPGASEQDVAALRAAALSGDWRTVRGGDLELVAALAVNVPGFPVPRVQVGISASGEALLAAGIVEQHPDVPRAAVDPAYIEAFAGLVALKMREMQDRSVEVERVRSQLRMLRAAQAKAALSV